MVIVTVSQLCHRARRGTATDRKSPVSHPPRLTLDRRNPGPRIGRHRDLIAASIPPAISPRIRRSVRRPLRSLGGPSMLPAARSRMCLRTHRSLGTGHNRRPLSLTARRVRRPRWPASGPVLPLERQRRGAGVGRHPLLDRLRLSQGGAQLAAKCFDLHLVARYQLSDHGSGDQLTARPHHRAPPGLVLSLMGHGRRRQDGSQPDVLGVEENEPELIDEGLASR
jgi:hypothetical protein